MTHASVFSGIGGPEVAATMLGWDNLFHCEINPFGRKVLNYWYPNSKSYEDITQTENKKRYPANWKQIRADILKRAFNCCEFCGIPNHVVRENGSKVVLTIAHLDHTP